MSTVGVFVASSVSSGVGEGSNSSVFSGVATPGVSLPMVGVADGVGVGVSVGLGVGVLVGSCFGSVVVPGVSGISVGLLWIRCFRNVRSLFHFLGNQGVSSEAQSIILFSAVCHKETQTQY